MIQRLLLPSIGLLSFFWFSCSQSPKETDTSNSPVTPDLTYLGVQTTVTKNHPDIQLLETKAKDTLYKGSDGILISIIAVLKPEVFATLEKPYQAIWADLIYEGDSTFSSRVYEYPLFEKTTFYPSTPYLLQKADTVEIQFHLPYRKLAPSTKNNKSVRFDIGFFPLSFTSDPNRTESKLCAPPSKKAIALYAATVSMEMPDLHNIQVSLQDIQLDSKGKKTSSYDVAMGGKGLPDIYWQLWCGNELVYYAPTLKNTEQYTERTTSPRFTMSNRDQVEIHILDFDNGPFNQDDVIYIWKGSYHELRKLRFLQDKKLKGANVLIE